MAYIQKLMTAHTVFKESQIKHMCAPRRTRNRMFPQSQKPSVCSNLTTSPHPCEGYPHSFFFFFFTSDG